MKLMSSNLEIEIFTKENGLPRLKCVSQVKKVDIGLISVGRYIFLVKISLLLKSSGISTQTHVATNYNVHSNKN